MHGGSKMIINKEPTNERSDGLIKLFSFIKNKFSFRRTYKIEGEDLPKQTNKSKPKIIVAFSIVFFIIFWWFANSLKLLILQTKQPNFSFFTSKLDADIAFKNGINLLGNSVNFKYLPIILAFAIFLSWGLVKKMNYASKGSSLRSTR